MAEKKPPKISPLSKCTMGDGRTLWAAYCGRKRKTFGNVETVPREEAVVKYSQWVCEVTALHGEPIKKVPAKPTAVRQITVHELCDDYLDWVRRNQPDETFRHKKAVLTRFCSHVVERSDAYGAGRPLGELAALRITPQHLHESLERYSNTPIVAGRNIGQLPGESACCHFQTMVKAAWSWAEDPLRGARLPKGHLPFRGMAKPHVSPPARSEHDLPTEKERAAILKWMPCDFASKVRAGTGRWRPREKSEYQWEAYPQYLAVTQLLYMTGARPKEIVTLRVGEVSLRNGTINKAEHKTVKKSKKPRVIHLNSEAVKVLTPFITGRNPDDAVFLKPGGSPLNVDAYLERFKIVRRQAGVRDEFTAYWFRHLWITDMIDANVPVSRIAELAGTSPAMIERTYGHLRATEHKQAINDLDKYRSKRAG